LRKPGGGLAARYYRLDLSGRDSFPFFRTEAQAEKRQAAWNTALDANRSEERNGANFHWPEAGSQILREDQGSGRDAEPH
jgi:hypothetical protein